MKVYKSAIEARERCSGASGRIRLKNVCFGWEDLALLSGLLVISIGYLRGDVQRMDTLAYLAFMILGIVWGLSSEVRRER